MADNVNHNSVEFLNGTICLSLVERGLHTPTRHLGDYTEIFRAKGWSEEAIAKNKLHIGGHWDRNKYLENQKKLSLQAFRNGLSSDAQIWEIPFLENSLHDDEDF